MTSNTRAAIGGSAAIKGPDPFADITAFTRAYPGAFPSTTATCVNGSNQLTIVNPGAGIFQVGDGVTIFGCGTTNTIGTPTALTVTRPACRGV